MSETEGELEALPPQSGYMDEREQSLANRIYEAIMEASRWSERGLQSAEFRLGVSDLGYCSERARRMLERQVPEPTDVLKAAIGTALGDMMEHAIDVSEEFPGSIVQSEVTVTLMGEQQSYTLTGHPDIILPAEGVLLDGKSAYGLALAQRTGMLDQQKKFQRQCYGHAAFEAGMFGDTAYEDVRVGNVWIDRAGIEQGLHVKLEPLDTDVLDEAARWLDEVVYAWQNKVEAQKEPAREVCATTCGYFRVCREWQSDVTGLLEDPVIISAVELYDEGAQLERRGRQLKKEANAHLRGVSGSTGKHTLRWTHVNAVETKATVRRAHDRIEIKPIKGVE